MPFDSNMKVQNPNPNRQDSIKIGTLINYAGDSSYPYQKQAIEILDGLRTQGIIDDKEVEKAKKSQLESGSDRVGEDGVKQDDVIMELSDGTQLTQDILNTPEKLKIVEKNKDNLNFLPLIPHIDEDKLHLFSDSKAPQIRKSVAQRISIDELSTFFEETDESVLDVLVDRLPAMDVDKLLKSNDYLSVEQTDSLLDKEREYNEFIQDLRYSTEQVGDDVFDKINKLDGRDFTVAIEEIRDKLKEDEDYSYISKLDPKKLSSLYMNEMTNDPSLNPQSSLDKELETGKVKVYRGGDFTDNRGYVSTDEFFAKEFGDMSSWEIDKSKILDLTNSEHRDMVSTEFGDDMLNRLSPDGDLPFAGDADVLDAIERVSKKLGFDASAQSEGFGMPVSFDVYDVKNSVDYPTPDPVQRESIFGSDAIETEKSIEVMSKHNYEGLLELANIASSDEDNLFDDNVPIKEKMVKHMKPKDVGMFADDENDTVRLSVAENIDDTLAKEYIDVDDSPEIVAEYVKKMKEKDFDNSILYHESSVVREAVADVVKNPVTLDKLLSNELNLETPNRAVLTKVVDKFEPEQMKSVVYPKFAETDNYDFKRAVQDSITPDKIKNDSDFENYSDFISPDGDSTIIKKLTKLAPEESANKHFSSSNLDKLMEVQKWSNTDLTDSVYELSDKYTADNAMDVVDKFLHHLDPERITDIVDKSKVYEKLKKEDRLDEYTSFVDNLISYDGDTQLPKYSYTPVATDDLGGVNVYQTVTSDELNELIDGGKTGNSWTSSPQKAIAKKGNFTIVAKTDTTNPIWDSSDPKDQEYTYEYDGLSRKKVKNDNYEKPSIYQTHFKTMGEKDISDIVDVYDENGNKVDLKKSEGIDFSRAIKSNRRTQLVNISDIEQLVEFDRDAVPYKEGWVDELANSIKENGLEEPILIYYYQNDNKALLVEGNHRLSALKKLNETKIPIIIERVGTKAPQNAVDVKAFDVDKLREKYKGDIPSIMSIDDIVEGAKSIPYDRKPTREKFQTISDTDGYVISYDDAEKVVRKYFNEDEIDIKRATSLFTEHRAFGSYLDGTMKFVDNPDITTPYHESVHAFLDKFYTYDEKQELYDEIRNKLSNPELSDIEAEEKLADMFFPYVKKKETVTGKIKNYFDKAINFVKGLVGKEDKIKRLFSDIESKKRRSRDMDYTRADNLLSVQQEYYQNPELLTSKFFNLSEADKETMSRQEISDLIKSGKANLKKPEKQLLNRVLDESFKNQDKIDLSKFKDAIVQNLLPLSVVASGQYSDYGMDNLSAEWNTRNNIYDTNTMIYNSPVEHGNTGHFGSEAEGLFGHTRVWDNDDDKIRYVSEVQSDFFQKNRSVLHRDNLKDLLPYKNTWFERLIKETIRDAAVAGFKKLRFPTPHTISVIEGYSTGRAPYELHDADDFAYFGSTLTHAGEDYVVVDEEYNGGEFSAIPERYIKERINLVEDFSDNYYSYFSEMAGSYGFNQIEHVDSENEIPSDFDPMFPDEEEDLVDVYNEHVDYYNDFVKKLKVDIYNKNKEKFEELYGKPIDSMSKEEYSKYRKDFLSKHNFDMNVDFFSTWNWGDIDLNNYSSEVSNSIVSSISDSVDLVDFYKEKYDDNIRIENGDGIDENDISAYILFDGYSEESFNQPYTYDSLDMDGIDEDEYVDRIQDRYDSAMKRISAITSKKRPNSVSDIPVREFITVEGIKYTIGYPRPKKIRLSTGEELDTNNEEVLNQFVSWRDKLTDADKKDYISEFSNELSASDHVVLFYKNKINEYIKANRNTNKVSDGSGFSWLEFDLDDADRNAIEAFQEFGDPFYSKLVDEVANIEGKNIKVQRLPNLLRNVSKEEIAWSGLDDFVKENASGGKISKEEVLKYLKDNNTTTNLRTHGNEKTQMVYDLSNVPKDKLNDINPKFIDFRNPVVASTIPLEYIDKHSKYLYTDDWIGIVDGDRDFPLDFLEKHKGNIDWARISFNPKLSEDAIREFSDKVRWDAIQSNNKLSESLLRDFSDKLEWDSLAKTQKLSEDFIRDFSDKLTWSDVSRYQNMSDDFIREHQDKVKWSFVSEYQKLSEDFVREFQDKVDWYSISIGQNLSESFMKEFSDRIDWNSVSEHQELSENFIREFHDKVNWYLVSKDQNISENFIREFQDEVNFDTISRYQNLSENFIREFQDGVNWLDIAQHQSLSSEFIKEFEDKLSKYVISRHQSLSEDFMSNNPNLFDWSPVSSFQVLSEDFIRKNSDHVKWSSICQHQKLSEDFIREFQDKVEWNDISRYQKLSENFIREFSDKIYWSYIGKDVPLSDDFVREYASRLNPNLIYMNNKISDTVKNELFDNLMLRDEPIKGKDIRQTYASLAFKDSEYVEGVVTSNKAESFFTDDIHFGELHDAVSWFLGQKINRKDGSASLFIDEIQSKRHDSARDSLSDNNLNSTIEYTNKNLLNIGISAKDLDTNILNVAGDNTNDIISGTFSSIRDNFNRILEFYEKNKDHFDNPDGESSYDNVESFIYDNKLQNLDNDFTFLIETLNGLGDFYAKEAIDDEKLQKLRSWAIESNSDFTSFLNMRDKLNSGVIPGAPFEDYIPITLKNALRYAVENGMDSISIANSDQIKFKYDYIDDEADWHQKLYDEKIPNWLNKYIRRMGWDTELSYEDFSDIHTKGSADLYKKQLTVKITDKMKHDILQKGQPLFQKNPYAKMIDNLIKSTPEEELHTYYNHENPYVREAVVRKVPSDKLHLFLDDESPIVRDALYEVAPLKYLMSVYNQDRYNNSLPALRDRLITELQKEKVDSNFIYSFSDSNDPAISEAISVLNLKDKDSILEASKILSDENNPLGSERGIDITEEESTDEVMKESSEKLTEVPVDVSKDRKNIKLGSAEYAYSDLEPEIKEDIATEINSEEGMSEAFELKKMLDDMGFQKTDRDKEIEEKVNDKDNWTPLKGNKFNVNLTPTEQRHFEVMGDMLTDIKDIVGDDVYLVGGATRDLLMRKANITDKEINDLDFTVPTYKQIEKLAEHFSKDPNYGVDDSGLKFSHVKAIHKDTGFEFEFTSYRKEAYHDTSRKPDVVEGSMDDEIKRRDFTINTLFAKINDVSSDGVDIEINENVSSFIDDLNNGVLRTADNPDRVFSDDPLRLLRALRFANRYGFELAPEVIESINNFDPALFSKVSGERIRDEFGKILRTGGDVFAYQVVSKVFPELTELYGDQDTMDHINRAIKIAQKYDDDVLLWTALLHDISKPQTVEPGKTMEKIYPGHAEESLKMAKPIIDKLKLSRRDRKALEKLIGLHTKFQSMHKMKLNKVIDFAIDNKNVFPYLVKFQDIDYHAHAGNFFDMIPEQENFRIVSRMNSIYNLLDSIPADIKSTWEGVNYRENLKKYINSDIKYRDAFENGAKGLYNLYNRKVPVIPQESYEAPNGETSNLTEGQWRQTRSDKFKEWFGDWINNPDGASKIVDYNGEPQIVYHGTTFDFDEFGTENATPLSFFGKGIYFTDQIEDANLNYAGIGPDLESKIEEYKEMMSYENPELTDNELTEMAMKVVAGNNKGNIYPTYLDMKNPAVVESDGGTLIHISLETDEEGDIIDETGNGIDLMDAITAVAGDFDFADGDAIWDNLMTSMGDRFYDGVYLYDVLDELRNMSETADITDEDGRMAQGEYIKRVLEYMGFDGIIQKNADKQFSSMNMPDGTNHYVVFDNDRVKSAIGNSGEFEEGKGILHQKKSDYSKPLTDEEIDSYTKKAYEQLQGLIPVTMEEMDRDNGKAILNGLKSLMFVDPRTANQGTFDHEVLHIATEILGEKEAWNQFLMDAGWDGESVGNQSWVDAQEKLADEFMAYSKKLRDGDEKRTIFDKAKSLFNDIANMFRKEKQYDRADYFYKLSKGKLKKRSTLTDSESYYSPATQSMFQRNNSIPDNLKDKVINTELRVFGKNPSGKDILRGQAGKLKLNDDFIRHLKSDGVNTNEIDFINHVINTEKLNDKQITPDEFKNLLLQYLYPVRIENSYNESYYTTTDSNYDDYDDMYDLYSEYMYNNGDIYGFSSGWNKVDENKVPPQILDDLIDRASTYSDYYGGEQYGLVADGGTNYREIMYRLPFNVTKAHPDFATNDMIGWIRTDVDESDNRTLRVNEIQSDLFQKARSLKPYDELKSGDTFKMKGMLYTVDSVDDRKIDAVNKYNVPVTVYDYEYEKYRNFGIGEDDVSEIAFVKNMQPNWYKFFIDSAIQNAYNSNFDNVLFPTGDTIAKVEGYTDSDKVVDESKHILSELDNVIDDIEPDGKIGKPVIDRLNNLPKVTSVYVDTIMYLYNSEYLPLIANKEDYDLETYIDLVDKKVDEFKSAIGDMKTDYNKRLEHYSGIKKKTDEVKSFYDNKIKSYLDKTKKGRVVEYTDKHGQTWNKLLLNESDASPVQLFQKKSFNKLFKLSSNGINNVLYNSIFNAKKDLVGAWNRWFKEGDRSAKSVIHHEIKSNPELKNALINNFYEQYKEFMNHNKKMFDLTDGEVGEDVDMSDLTFNDFIDSDIKIYRGITGKESETDGFDSWTLNKDMAEKLSKDGEVIEQVVKPKDTFGLLDYMSNEYEILVPKNLSDEHYKDFGIDLFMNYPGDRASLKEDPEIKYSFKNKKWKDFYNRMVDISTGKESLDVNISSLTKTKEDIKQWAYKAREHAKDNNFGRVANYNHKILERGKDWLNDRFEGKINADMDIEDSIGLFGGYEEPSLNMNVAFDPNDRNELLSGLIDFADEFDQSNIHLSRQVGSIPENVSFGDIQEDSSTYQPEFNITLTKKLTNKEVKDLENKFNEAGLPGFTINDEHNSINFYSIVTNKGDIENVKEYEKFFNGAEEIIEHIQSTGHLKNVQKGIRQLWNIGDEQFGATTGFEEARSKILQPKQVETTDDSRNVTESIRNLLSDSDPDSFGEEHTIPVTSDTSLKIIKFGANNIELIHSHAGKETAPIFLTGQQVDSFVTTFENVMAKRDVALDTIQNKESKKLYPKKSDLKAGSFVKVNDSVKYIQEVTDDRVVLGDVNKDGVLVDIENIYSNTWEKLYSGITVDSTGKADTLFDSDISEWSDGMEIDSPYLGGKFTVKTVSDVGAIVKNSETNELIHLDTSAIKKMVSRSKYANKVSKVTDKVMEGINEPKFKSIMDDKPSKLVASFGSGAGNESYFCADTDDSMIGFFKPSVMETMDKHQMGIEPGTSFSREVVSSFIDTEFGINLVPPTVFKKVNNMVGSYQKFIDGGELLKQRIENDFEPIKQKTIDKLNGLSEKYNIPMIQNLDDVINGRIPVYLIVNAVVDETIGMTREKIEEMDISKDIIEIRKQYKNDIEKINKSNFETPQIKKLFLLDYLIGNGDRHLNNILIDKSNNIHGIDNGLSFANDDGLSFFRTSAYEHLDDVIELKNAKEPELKEFYKSITDIYKLKKLKEKFVDTEILKPSEFNGMLSRILEIVNSGGKLYNFVDTAGTTTTETINSISTSLAGMSVDEALEFLQETIEIS